MSLINISSIYSFNIYFLSFYIELDKKYNNVRCDSIYIAVTNSQNGNPQYKGLNSKKNYVLLMTYG
jgi:hypothetical protein